VDIHGTGSFAEAKPLQLFPQSGNSSAVQFCGGSVRLDKSRGIPPGNSALKAEPVPKHEQAQTLFAMEQPQYKIKKLFQNQIQNYLENLYPLAHFYYAFYNKRNNY
jgi:hypothetical protein